MLVFPHVRPDLHSFIDNVIGIQLTTEARETFSLCEKCIGTMDMFITFRSKCRSHYDKVREMKIMNQAVNKMFPVLQQQQEQQQQEQQQQDTSTHHASPSPDVRGINGSINADLLFPELKLEEISPRPVNDSTMAVNDCAGSAIKRMYSQLSPGIGVDSSTKKSHTQNKANRQTKYNHIRELMQRFRESRLLGMDSARRPSSRPSFTIEPRSLEFTDKRPLANVSNTFIHHTPPCKPCVVVVQKVLTNQTATDGSRKS